MFLMKNTSYAWATALALATVAATSFGDIRAVTPVAWDGNPDCWQMKRHLQKMSIVTNGGAKVVFIGDSITHFWETNGKAQWAKYFAEGNRRALNLGTSGDRTEHVLWRITEGRELDGYEAKCILLMIGTNNSGHFPFDKEPPLDTIRGVREILRVIAEKQPTARTILTAIFPRGATAEDGCRRRNDVVNRELSRLADGRKVIWCDFTDKFLTPDGRLSRAIFPDLLHPGPLGYEMWASAVVPLVDRVLSASPDETIPSVWPSGAPGYPSGEYVATTPVPAFGVIGWWDKGRPFEKRTAIVDGDGEYDIVMVGDSITHRWEREGGEGVRLFAELQKQYRILNLGIGGDQTQHVLWRLQNGELEGYKAKLFTVMIGTNNRGREINGIAEGVKMIVELIRSRHPESKVVLMPIFPRGEKPDDKLRVGNEKVNEIIAKIPDGKDVLWLDFNKKFLTEDGTLTKEVMNDLLHPNERGYQIWLDAILPVFREICGPAN